jgi:erythromycin esterase-like protein
MRVEGVGEKDPAITSDPFGTFMPDVYTSIEKNDTYKEWIFDGIFSNINIDKRYYSGLNDSVTFITSGIHGLNMLLDVSQRLTLPEKGKRVEIDILYEYQPILPDNKMMFELIFFAGNTPVKKIIEKIPASIKWDSDGLDIKNPTIPVLSYKYRIPKGANNMKVALYTYDKKIIDHLYPVENVTDSVIKHEYGTAYLALNRFGIRIDNKPLEEYVYNHKLPFTSDEVDAVSFKTSDRLVIDKNIEIMGIGESVHGSGTFTRQENEMILQLISEGFRIIGFETSVTLGIAINDYIKGHRDEIDDVLSSGQFNFYNNPLTKELLDSIRIYNRDNNNAVSFFGFDIPLLDEHDHLACAANDHFKISEEEIWNDYLKNFYNMYGSYYVNATKMNYERLSKQRDRIMSENIFYLKERLAEDVKMVLVGHLGHLGKKESSQFSMGFLLSEKYGKQYGVIGLFAGRGTFLSQTFQGFDNERIVKDFPFSAPIGKSLEQLCERLETERFYINDVKNIKLLDKILYSRYIGAGYRVMQFEPIDIRKELDALWFERNSEPIRILSE